MVLIAMRGLSTGVNQELMRLAFENSPSLIVDCANCANPHSMFPSVTQEQLHGVYVLNAEAVYRFRDTLIKLPELISKLGVRYVVVTTIHSLFSYDDEEENHDILEHCWELMRKLGESSTVVAGVGSSPVQERLASLYADRFI
jgi:hypothetical protein